MKSKIIEEFNLPKYVKGKSFAEASKAINKKFEGREGVEVERTKKEMLSRLAEAQEYVKMQESLKSNSQEVPDMMNGQIPQGFEEFAPQNQMFEGGEVTEEGEVTIDPATGQPIDMAGIAGMAGTALNLGMSAFGDSGIDTSGASGKMQKQSTGLGAATGAIQGATAGAALGPMGMIGGAVIGSGLGLLGADNANGDIDVNNRNADVIATGKNRNDFSGGGWVLQNGVESALAQKNKGALYNTQLGDVDLDPSKYSVGFNPSSPTLSPNKSIMGKTNNDYSFSVEGLANSTPNKGKSKVGEMAGKAGDWLGDNYGNILRTAPIVSNALQLKNLEKPTKVNLDRMDSRYKKDYIDERALENRVQNEATNTINALSASSNGSVGTFRSNLLAAQGNKTKALSDAYLKADDLNRNENTRAQQFNQRNDMANLRQGTVEQQMNDQNEGAYKSAKSMLQSQLANDIGNFGKEKVNMKQVAEMFGYKWDGTYFIDKKGKKIDPKTIGQNE